MNRPTVPVLAPASLAQRLARQLDRTATKHGARADEFFRLGHDPEAHRDAPGWFAPTEAALDREAAALDAALDAWQKIPL